MRKETTKSQLFQATASLDHLLKAFFVDLRLLNMAIHTLLIVSGRLMP
jgi:hypothetical protein